MEELGFGPDYDPFREGFRQQDMQIATKLHGEDDCDGDGEHHQDVADHAAELHSPTAVGAMPAYLMHDNSSEYHVATYAQGDASADETSTGAKNSSPKPWSPLQPRRSLAARPRGEGPQMEQLQQVPAWTPHLENADDRFTQVPTRRSRRSLIRLGTRDIADETADHDLPPLPTTLLDYYHADSATAPEQDPFADFMLSPHHPPADATDDNMASGARELAYMSPRAGEAMQRPALRTADTTASSVYSDVTHELPPVQVTDSSMSSLKRAITEMSGFQVVTEDSGDEEGSPFARPSAQRMETGVSYVSSSGSMSSEASEDLEARDGLGLNERSVRKVLRDRRKKSIALRNGSAPMRRSYSRLSVLQRK